MATYHLNEASLIVPDIFKDRTMHLFVMSDNNASEFTFVVSRATANIDDTVESVASRIVKELEVTLTGFSLKYSQSLLIDGQAAAEIFYQFKNGTALIWQKQSIVLLNDEYTGRKILCFTGTCPDNFSDYYLQQYKSVIDSVHFRSEEKDDFIPCAVPEAGSGIYFAFDKDSKALLVFNTLELLYKHVSLPRALNGGYFFYDATGKPLHIAPLPKRSEEEQTQYTLWTTSPRKAQPLSAILTACKEIKGTSELNSMEAVRSFLRMEQR